MHSDLAPFFSYQPVIHTLNMIFIYRSIPGLMFNFVEAVLNQRLSTPSVCAGFESPILQLELNWQDLILHLPYLPLCPMTEVDHQQEVELFPPKESLQAVELSPRYVINFFLGIFCRKTALSLNFLKKWTNSQFLSRIPVIRKRQIDLPIRQSLKRKL